MTKALRPDEYHLPIGGGLSLRRLFQTTDIASA